MGVIYKLKENVVSFIIDQKKSNPKIGVRQLSALISEKFQTNVSKSSVSAVLKNASLSSSVGRRSVESQRKEKFSIPFTRKNEISKNMQKLGFIKEEEKDKEEKKSKFRSSKDEKEIRKVETKKRKKGLEKDPEDTALPLLPDPVAAASTMPSGIGGSEKEDGSDFSQENDFGFKVEQIRKKRENQKIKVHNGMGYVFLKAAQLEVSSKSIISELFRKHIRGPLSGPFDLASEMFMFFKFLGVKTFDEMAVYKGHGLWQLNSYCGIIPDEENVLLKLSELFQWDKTVTGKLPLSIVMEYNLEKKHVFSEINGFKILLEDGSEVLIDSRMASFGVSSGEAVSLRNTAPINKAMTWLSHCLISNIQCAIFRTIPGRTKFDKIFYDMVAVFENFPGKKILKISTLNENNKMIAEFSVIPAQKRTFMIGVDPQQREFEELTKTAKWAGKKPWFHQATDRIFYCAETRTSYAATRFQEEMDELRVITIWRDNEKEPCWAILTNSEKEKSEQILDMYVSRWPYFTEQGNMFSGIELLSNEGTAMEAATKESESTIFSTVFNDYVESLNKYCKRHFFQQNLSDVDINDMMSIIYGISGSIYETRHYVEVILDVPESALYRSDLRCAANSVNQAHIIDSYGRKLWVKV